MDRRHDPRSIVTPYAFAVHPDLLGRPLATPWQRLGAIFVDLIVIGILSQVGGAPLAFASALLLFWLAFRKPGREAFGKLFRIAVGCLGVLVLLVAVTVVLAVRYGDEVMQSVEETVAEMAEESAPGAGDTTDPEAAGEPGAPVEAGLLEVIESARGAVAFRNAETREEAQVIADRLVRNASELGLARSDIRQSLTELIPQDAPWSNESGEIISQAMSGVSPTRASEAVEGDPEEEPADAPATISDPRALDSIRALELELETVAEERDDYVDRFERAQAALAEAEEGGLFDWLRNLIDELGLGFGWAALYLTITHAWWKGTSVGKKLFRIRVVMIDKRPLNWWLSFERAGGYAAGFATGLLGFAQIFWDPNRQAIHDKVSETIVIQDGKEPIPGPWMEEGRAQWALDQAGGGNPG